MKKQYLNLIPFFEGYVRNYRRMNLSQLHNRSMFTKREIDYFANLGEILGFDAFVEDSKLDKMKGRSRPMDLSWWKWDARIDDEHFLYLALHLERENIWNKGVDTIEKLFSQTEEGYLPQNVIGIQFVEAPERIEHLNDLIMKKNDVQKSNALMIYRFYDAEFDLERVWAYSFTPQGLNEVRKAVCSQDHSGYWYMCFDEEFAPFKENNEIFLKRNFEKEVVKRLQEKGVQTIQSFRHFSIDHKEPKTMKEMKMVNAEIRNEYKNYNGVYIYLNEAAQILYIGIGNLAERVRFHYYESFGKFSGRGCEKHIKFFTQFQGSITVLWAIVDEKEKQRRIKKELTDLLKPKYEKLKKEGLLY